MGVVPDEKTQATTTQAHLHKHKQTRIIALINENHNSSSQANKYHSSAHLLCGIIERELQHKLTSKQESQLCPLVMWDNKRELQPTAHTHTETQTQTDRHTHTHTHTHTISHNHTQ